MVAAASAEDEPMVEDSGRPAQSMAPARPDRVGIAVATIVAAVLAMSFQDAVVKYISAEMPLWQIYVLRSLLTLPILFVLLRFRRRPTAIRPISPGWALLRSLLLATSYIAFYASLPLLSLSVAAAACYTAPLFITLLSALWLRDPVGPRRWAAIVVGFAGVLTILRPGTEAFSVVTLLPILSALLYAWAAIITRARCAAEAPFVLSAVLNASFLLVGAIATAALAIVHPTAAQVADYPFLLGPWVALGGRDWATLALLAGLVVAVSSGVAKAYQSGPPAIIATFDYAYLGFAALWGFAIFSDVPDRATVIGTLLIAGAGALVMRQPATAKPGLIADRAA
jgi:drug/metabolite transporter (DMT)-like permease